jgi:hypothetical protein
VAGQVAGQGGEGQVAGSDQMAAMRR